MRMNIMASVTAIALAGALGCGAETGTGTSEGVAVEGTPEAAEDVGQTAQELRNGFQAFAWIDSLGRQNAGFSASIPGTTITPSKLGLGAYQVLVDGLAGGGPEGNVQVVAQGSDNRRCKASTWTLNAGILNIQIRCVAPGAGAADSGFFVRYAKATAPAGFGTGAYLRTSNPGAAFPTVLGSWNSTGGVNSVAKMAGPAGQYRVTLPGLALVGGAVQVTSTGSTPDHCKVVQWVPSGANQLVDVRCFSNAGAAVDAPFSLNYIGTASSVGLRSRGAFVWADNATAGLYAPRAEWSKNTGNTAGSCSKANVAGRFVGPDIKYFIRHENLPFPGGSPHVTAYGTNNTYCKVNAFSGPVDGAFVDVETRCFNAAGAVVESQYAETYARRDAPTACP